MVASALSHCVIGAIFINKKWSSLNGHGSSWKPGAVRCSSYKENFQAVKRSAPSFTPTELTLPLASQASPPSTDSKRSDASGQASEEAAMESSQKDDDVFGKASKALEKLTVAQLLIYGGLISGGLYLLASILNSFEGVPLLPETLQVIGVLYAILCGSRMFEGKPLTLTPSPVRAITELVESRGSLVQKTNLELPQDLDVRVLTAMEKLSRERDDAINKLEVLRKKVADYARVVAEKEALEAVAVQLAQERDEALSEVIALKQAVDAMSDRMRTVENTLQQELEPLKQSSHSLETVALQLASERDFALKELSELKEELTLAKYKEEERIALESLASDFAEERDKANLENKRLKEILASLQAASPQDSGLSAEQELFFQRHIDASGMQFINLLKPYDDQKEEVDKFVSHLVEEYGAPSEWTLEYLKRFLEESASKSLETSSASAQPEESSPETSLNASYVEESDSKSLETSSASAQPEESSPETLLSASYVEESASKSQETSVSLSNPDESSEISTRSLPSETESPP